MRTPKSILASLSAWVLGKTTFSASAMEKSEAVAVAKTPRFQEGQTVRLTSTLYGTSEEGTLLDTTGLGYSYGTHTVLKADGTRFRTQGTLEHLTTTSTDKEQA